MMTSSQIRQSFLDFFKSKQHTIVPSSSLLPDSPNLLFTNAGMNQFVPIFLGQTKCPYKPGRAADTQKCIRAGGKHNDLEDVGLDTYHHTFFEMLGNWSFGDYFKKEAIDWAWELVVDIWKFPPQRLYATVFSPHFETENDRWQKALKTAVEFAEHRINGGGTRIATGEGEGVGAMNYSDAEAASFWAEHFLKAGIDPLTHIIPGNRRDNFWMMGETGPCGPCSELHVDLTPGGDTKGSLVNKGDARCIEIWNLVFIQFNANPDGTFSPLPAKHVDTGMGFERVTSIIQGTKNFNDFANAKISNYETDIFRPIFDKLEELSGKKYGSTLPNSDSQPSTLNPQQSIDIAFRVIADHIRTLSFAIADGIQPGNNDRNYVLRRILRRAVRYGRTLGFKEPFFYKLVDVLADAMGDVFPEIRAKKKHIQDVIRAEEEAFNKTLDNGLKIFQQIIGEQMSWRAMAERVEKSIEQADLDKRNDFFLLHKKHAAIPEALGVGDLRFSSPELRQAAFDLVGASTVTALLDAAAQIQKLAYELSGSAAFVLSDTYGFPIDLTELMTREIGMSVDKVRFGILEEEQRTRARAAQKKEVIQVDAFNFRSTKFVGYDVLETNCNLLGIIDKSNEPGQVPDFFAVTDVSPLYAEMGGQVGDKGKLLWFRCGECFDIIDTQKRGDVFFFKLHPSRPFELNQRGMLNIAISGEPGKLVVDKSRRNAIQRHHTVTHLLHWALHEVVSKEASQKGSFVGPDKLTFDFNSPPLTPHQVADIERLVNERIVENAGVAWTEVPYADVKSRKDVMQFFGDKYGDVVRVVQIGGHAGKLDGYSMELCGGTHTRATGEVGLFRIVGENAIAAGVRRIEAVAGLEAYRKAADELALIKSLAGKVNSPVHELEKKIESLLEHQKAAEKQIKIAQQREASNAASNLLEEIKNINGVPAIIHNLGSADGDFLQAVADSLKGRFQGVIVLGGVANGAVALIAAVSPDLTKQIQAGKIIQQIAPIVGGRGGGKPDNARGGGKDAGKLDEALSRVKELLAGSKSSS